MARRAIAATAGEYDCKKAGKGVRTPFTVVFVGDVENGIDTHLWLIKDTYSIENQLGRRRAGVHNLS